ncbi:MAG: HEPN domain-containing protein [Deltaproteobacteria bacterium]|nr:HEPN domain-containing protein [Deltaproteobacteria bacterium]
MLEQRDTPLSKVVRKSAALTEFAVQARYPGPSEPVTADEFMDALSTAEAVARWAETELHRIAQG